MRLLAFFSGKTAFGRGVDLKSLPEIQLDGRAYYSLHVTYNPCLQPKVAMCGFTAIWGNLMPSIFSV
jgi:hypothetical protein